MKNKKTIPTSRLLIHDSMSMSVRNRKIPAFIMVLHPMISLAGILSVIFTMQGFFDFPIPMQFMLYAVIIAVFGMFLIRSVSKKAGFAAVILVLLTVPFFLVFYREQAMVGAQNIYEIMHSAIFHEVWVPDGKIQIEGKLVRWDTEMINSSIAQLYGIVLIILVALMEYTDVLLTQGHSGKVAVAIRFLMTFPFLESGLYFGLETSSIAVFLMIFFWIASISLVRPKLLKQSGDIQKNTDKLQKDFLLSADRHFMPHESAAMIVLLMGALLSFVSIKGASSYTRSDEINERRSAIMRSVRNFSIRDATGLLNRLPGSLGINVISDEVDLTKRGDLNFDGSTVFKVDLGGAADETDYYMRGIVRSEYTGKGWATPTSLYRSQMDLFQSLTDINRMPQTILHSDHVDELRTDTGKFPVVRCEVHAQRSEAVNYLPYQSIYDTGTKYRYDTEIELSDHQNYSFWLMNCPEIDWCEVTDNAAVSSNPFVAQYSQFVRDNYLTVPDTEAMEHIRADFSQYLKTEPNYLLTDVLLSMIRSYLWNRADYTVSPGPTPDEEDFAEYFLMKNHKGFCAHYATAAVLLCRMNGIPARYVQGYVLTEGNFVDAVRRSKLSGSKDTDYHLEVADEQAHAWVEVYIEGYGWLPYEFTEGIESQWHTASVPPVTQMTTMTTTMTTMNGLTSSTTTTTTTAVSGAAVTAKGSGAETPDGGDGLVMLKKIVQIVLVVLVIAAVLFGWYAWHRAVLNKRKREMYGRNPNRSAETSYRFFLRLLGLLGIRQKAMSHEAFAVKAEADCRLLEPGRIAEIIRMMQTEAFSRSGIEKKEADRIADTVTQLAEKIYAQVNPFRRVLLRWFLHLV